MDASFSEDEKRFVLSEIIKVSAINVPTLVDFIKAHKVEPNWMLMQLPGGRNMNQTVGAVDNMFQMKFPRPSIEPLGKHKSPGDLNDHPAKRQAVTTSFEPPLAPAPAARPIQPRPLPATANGYQHQPAATIASTPTVSTTGKKRGRPSKADKEAQARAAHTRNTEYAPIVPAPPAPPTVTPTAIPTGPPQREYAPSPGYEITGAAGDQSAKKRARPTTMDSPRQPASSYLLVSPASTTGTPRALPEPLEQIERINVSPHDNGSSAPVDSRSPLFASLVQDQPQPQPYSSILPRPQAPPVPMQPSPRPPQAYEPYSRPDPIFPDRARSRSMPDQVPRNASVSPVVSRT